MGFREDRSMTDLQREIGQKRIGINFIKILTWPHTVLISVSGLWDAKFCVSFQRNYSL